MIGHCFAPNIELVLLWTVIEDAEREAITKIMGRRADNYFE